MTISVLWCFPEKAAGTLFWGLEQKQIKMIECSTLFQRNVTGTQGAL